ncbi:hypothetical protein SEA_PHRAPPUCCINO_120 [Mycobacterium phage Phrappuccino]|uniref:Uncharacterized protein n=1 Tax=Mycobacterium phage Phrappuccino TaxID=2591223 RepID=A0A514DDV8_9CAUD|nr:hypothetical protein KHQ87_gp120 [Mycobacterium phage Phrappuccino]QDH91795.1 hypothetical protein SEA_PHRAPPUCCINO_120 [Mycobacterium phage Phrappuccino]QIQ63237.1 hypothetical protein SEA_SETTECANDELA_120 [Mycobacterium phage Settecandela]
MGRGQLMKLEFTIEHVSPEEDLANRAMSLVMGYQQRRLGPRQEQMLLDMAAHGRPGFFGDSAANRDVLARLERRGLVRVQPGTPDLQPGWAASRPWRLTKFGKAVAAALTTVRSPHDHSS